MIPSKLISKGLSPGFGQKLPPVAYKDNLQGQDYTNSIKNKQEYIETNSIILNKLVQKMEKRQASIFSAQTKLAEINENLSKLVGILMNKWEGPLINKIKDEVNDSKYSKEGKQKEQNIQLSQVKKNIEEKKSNQGQYRQEKDLEWQSSTFQSRLKNINVKPPTESSSKNQVLVWIGQVCKRVLSAGFKLYKNGELDINKSKAFCSENILRNLIHLPRNLKVQYWEAVDTCLKTELFPYYRFNYPQTQEKGISSKLSNLLIQRDTFDENQNDMCSKSGVDFKLEPDQNYNSQIMKFFNFIMKLPSLAPGLKKQNQTNNSLGKLFKKDMQKIFQFVQFQKNLIDIQDFDPKDESGMTKIPTVQNYIKNNLILTKQQNEEKHHSKDDPDKKKKLIQYKQKVRSYTTKQIGQKLSQNFGMFTENEIESGNLKLNNSALMRVATKWCSQLEKCFDSKQIFNRENPWKMKDGSEKYLKKTEMVVLNLLLQQYKGKITKKMKQIHENNIENQIEFADKPLNQDLKKFSQQQAVVGQFCSSIFKLNESYLIKYLNMLIHGINLALKDFQKVQRVLRQHRNIIDNFVTEQCTPERFSQLYQMLSQIHMMSFDLQNKNENLSATPQLISFRIGDLLRCKCTSKQSQITSLYKLIQYLNNFNPQIIKILKIRNKLDQGNKDILINILYRQSMVIQIQLAIKSQKSKFIQCSNQFNHYFYQLQRSQFGPIMEMCNIWVNHDQRSKFYINKTTNYNNKKQQKNQIKSCCLLPQNYQNISLPFKCQSCNYFYYQYNFYQKHSKCNQCKKLTCCLCLFYQFNIYIKQEIFPILKQDQQLMEQNQNICSELPMDGGKFLNINSKEMKLKSFKPIIYEKQCHIFTRNQKSKEWQVIQKFNFGKSQKQRQLYMKKWFQIFNLSNIVFKSSETAQKYKHLNKYSAQKQYFIPKYFQKIKKSQKKSAALIKKDLTENIFHSISGQIRSVQKINFSQNKLLSIKLIGQKFPKTKWAMLNGNHIIKISQQDIINEWNQNLTQLFLNQNKIEDIQGIDRLKKLIELNISKNRLKNFPLSICNLNNLKGLNISTNQIPNIPKQIANLINLKKLNISDIKLQSFPSQIGNLINLVELDVSHNKLIKLPVQFSFLGNLQKLNLSNNQIYVLSDQFGNLKSLKILFLDKNKLQQLPESIGNLSYLTKIILKDNKLKILPKSFKNLHNLKYLQASCNQLSSLPKLQQLQIINLYRNNFLQFPQQLIKIHSMKQFRFDQIKLLRIYDLLGNWNNLLELQLFQKRIIQTSQNLEALDKIKEFCQERNIKFSARV